MIPIHFVTNIFFIIMSSKRQSKFFPRPVPPKKSKLDISKISVGIAASSSSTSSNQPHTNHQQQLARVPLTLTTNRNNVQLPVLPRIVEPDKNPFAMDDMWGDDDDELIMLATQVADKVQTFGQDIIVNAMDISSFDNFRPRNLGGTSTQMTEEGVDYLRDFLAANEEAEEAAAATVVAIESEDMFAPPAGRGHLDEAGPSKRPAGNQQQQQANDFGGCGSDLERGKNIQRNIIAAKDAQLKHALRKCDELKREETRLLAENQRLQERCQTKDGEIAMVRIDLNQQKKVQSRLRQERLDDMEKLRQEQTSKIKQLEIANTAQLHDLQFKVIYNMLIVFELKLK